jgi:hypothetical protein
LIHPLHEYKAAASVQFHKKLGICHYLLFYAHLSGDDVFVVLQLGLDGQFPLTVWLQISCESLGCYQREQR